MTAKKVSYTQITHDVVFALEAPLPFAEIMAKVDQIRPITTKNPKSTIRNAISQSQMLVSTGDGRYGNLALSTTLSFATPSKRLNWVMNGSIGTMICKILSAQPSSLPKNIKTAVQRTSHYQTTKQPCFLWRCFRRAFGERQPRPNFGHGFIV